LDNYVLGGNQKHETDNIFNVRARYVLKAALKTAIVSYSGTFSHPQLEIFHLILII